MMNKFQKELAAIDDMFENMSPEEFKSELEKAKGIYSSGETVDDFLNRTNDQYTNLITSMAENDLLEEAVHLLIEAKERLHLLDKFNDLNSIDSAYANTTIDKISKFIGGE